MVPFLRRLLSGDYRRAVAAEAAGDYAEAARHYALAGERDKVAEMHLLRAERAATPGEAESELRDALRWTEPATPGRARVARALGTALMKRAQSEGAATARDRERVKEAALLLEEAGEHRDAGSAWETLKDDEGAARAYEKGGHLEEMEAALARERERRRSDVELRDAFHAYEVALAHGERRAALGAIRRCVEIADVKGTYARLAAELAGKFLSGQVTLRRRPDGAPRRFAVASPARLGRDAELAVALRSPGVSRTHAEISVAGGGFRVRDAGSKHGTWLSDLPLAGTVTLTGSGRIRLGTDCELDFASEGRLLRLEVARGLDRGAVFYLQAPEEAVDLAPVLGVSARLRFAGDQPTIEARDLRLDGHPAAARVELIRGDVVGVPDGELDVV